MNLPKKNLGTCKNKPTMQTHFDVVLEALREAVRSRRATRDEIASAAEVRRARTVLKPYLEALAT